jgi:integrase
MTFGDLVRLAKETFYSEATIRNGRVIEGIRSHKPKVTELKHLSAYFGEFRLTSIGQADLLGYRKHRLAEGSQRGKERSDLSISTVNRELATMRRLLNHAESQGWIVRNPFDGAKLIQASAEVERNRVLSQTEETVLLAVCEPGFKQITYRRKKRKTGESQAITATVETGNPELKAAVLLALYCGLRQGEIFKLSWGDLSLEDNPEATIQGTHTKTQRGRTVPLPDPVVTELKRLPSFGSNGRVFRTRHVKRSWETARKLAGLEGLRFHDLRRTAASRMIAQNVALQFVGEVLGHAQLSTTAKYYVSMDPAMLEDIRRKMNSYASPRAQELSERVN